MLACLLAKRAYDFHFTYLNVAGGVEPVPKKIPHSSSDPAIVEGSPAIFANEDFYDLCARGALDLVFLGCAQVDGEGRTNVSVIGDWKNPKVRLPGGGGAAVMMPTAKRVVTWRTEHSTRTLVEKLDFVTAAGNLPDGRDADRGLPETRWAPGAGVPEPAGHPRRGHPPHRFQVRREQREADFTDHRARAGGPRRARSAG